MIWFVSVQYGGTTYRWASSPPTWDVLDDAGLPMATHGAWIGPSAVRADEAVPVEVIFPTGLSLAREEVSGRLRLSGCLAEVSLLAEGGAWPSRLVVRSGTVSEPEIGMEGEPVAFSIDVEEVDAALVPSATCVVTTETHAAATSAVIGMVYPTVYGRPGTFRAEDGTLVFLGATPAIVVDSEVVSPGGGDPDVVKAQKLLINNGAVLEGTTQVNLIYADSTSISGYSLHVSDCYATTDALGQPVTRVDVSADTEPIRTAGTYFISWEHGGATPMDSVVDTDAAGAVLLWWLRQSSVDIDFQRSASGFAYLDAYTLSGFTDAPLSPLDWAADRLADYPVKFVNGPAGKIVVPIRFMAQASEAIAAITVDDPVVSSVSGGTTGAVRLGPMKCSGKNQVTEVRVNWAKGLGSGTFYQQTVFSTDPNRSSKVSRNPSKVGALSKSSAVKAIEVSLTDCWSSATAFNVAQYVAWRDGAPKRTVTVAVPTATHGHLIEGDVVLYTDVPLGLVDVVALVDEVPLTASTMTELTLLLLR